LGGGGVLLCASAPRQARIGHALYPAAGVQPVCLTWTAGLRGGRRASIGGVAGRLAVERKGAAMFNFECACAGVRSSDGGVRGTRVLRVCASVRERDLVEKGRDEKGKVPLCGGGRERRAPLSIPVFSLTRSHAGHEVRHPPYRPGRLVAWREVVLSHTADRMCCPPGRSPCGENSERELRRAGTKLPAPDLAFFSCSRPASRVPPGGLTDTHHARAWTPCVCCSRSQTRSHASHQSAAPCPPLFLTVLTPIPTSHLYSRRGPAHQPRHAQSGLHLLRLQARRRLSDPDRA